MNQNIAINKELQLNNGLALNEALRQMKRETYMKQNYIYMEHSPNEQKKTIEY